MMILANYTNDLGIFFYLIPIVCAFCYSLSLFIKKDRTLSQSYLAITILVFGLGMILFFIYDHYLAKGRYEITYTIDLFFTIIGGVFVLSYFMSLMNPQKLTPKYFTFFIAAALALFLLILLIDIKIGVILWVGYLIYAAIFMYIRYRKLIRQHNSLEKQIKYQWIVWEIALFTIFAIVTLVKIFDTTSIPMKATFNIVSFLTLTSIFIVGFRSEAMPPIDELINLTDTFYLDKQQEKVSLIESKLKKYFTEQKPYLNPDLSLSDVATAIGVNTTYLSRVINHRLNINFFTLVNSYRLNHAINLIQERKGNISSDLLSMESGFKSRSVFYKLFHEQTGLSPQEYIKNHSYQFTSPEAILHSP